MAVRRQRVPSLPGTCGTPRVDGPETGVHFHRDAPGRHELGRPMAIRSGCRQSRSLLLTFLYDFSDEDLGEPSHDLGDGHGDLLAEALLNYLPRHRVRIWALREWIRSCVSYLSNGLLREGMTAISLETLVLLWREVVHKHPKKASDR
jgi:hypothetical protein